MASLRDAAFALDAGMTDPWSLRESLAVPVFPPLDGTSAASVRSVTERFGPAGGALRAIADGTANAWSHIDRARVVREISDRLRDPMIIRQNPTGLCGPLAIVACLARRDPLRYVRAAAQLLAEGELTCPTGRVIAAEAELRHEPVIAGDIGQVDWLLAATMRDDENIWEDVDDTANGLESMTFWTEQRGWTRDVLNMAGGGYQTCMTYGEIECMQQAQRAVERGGIAFLLVDRFLIKDGGDDDEEEARWQRSAHNARSSPSGFGDSFHSKDDQWPPDHWIEYLDGLNLGDHPSGSDKIHFRVWSWGREYMVTATVDAFSEYLYGVVTGWS